jgi:hypothetical protein
MKKVLFFFFYIGNNSTNDIVSSEKLKHSLIELKFLTNVISRVDIFDEKYIIPVAHPSFNRTIKQLSEENNLKVYKNIVYHSNQYEYPGFRVMNEVANECEEDTLFYYCHTKGSGNPSSEALDIFRLHTAKLIIDNVDDYFKDESIKKMGLFPSQQGWCWHNFFWIRSNYFKLKEVQLFSNRYLYESLIGELDDLSNYKMCVSPLIDDGIFEIKDYYMPDDLTKIANPRFKILCDSI